MVMIEKSYFWLKVCVFLDFFSVAIIIPLLPTYFRSAGITTQQHGMIMSIYHLSQIFGGILMGSFADIYSKRLLLIISFLGSAISYSLIGITSNLLLLFFSRILVGFVKQTLTISSSIVTSSSLDSSTKKAELLSHLNAAKTLGFILGPNLGSLLYRQGKFYPPFVSAGLFLLNITICFFFIPEKSLEIHEKSSQLNDPATLNKDNSKPSTSPGSSSLKQLFTFLLQHHLLLPLLCPVLLLFLDSVSSPSAIPSYLELQYHVDPSSLGYIFSFTSLVAFFCHSFMMKPILTLTSHSIQTTILLTLGITLVANLLEFSYSTQIFQYLLIYIPLTTLSSSIHHPIAKSYFLHSAPSKYNGTLLGILNLAENAVSVIAPLYAGSIYERWGSGNRALSAMIHYCIGCVGISILLSRSHSFSSNNNKDSSEIDEGELNHLPTGTKDKVE